MTSKKTFHFYIIDVKSTTTTIPVVLLYYYWYQGWPLANLIEQKPFRGKSLTKRLLILIGTGYTEKSLLSFWLFVQIVDQRYCNLSKLM